MRVPVPPTRLPQSPAYRSSPHAQSNPHTRCAERLTILTLLTVLLAPINATCNASEPSKNEQSKNDPQVTSPFVAGFERFSRHEEIDAEASGRLLLSELSCVACHASPDPSLAPKGGPNLQRAGLVLQRTWVTHFLADPQRAKPGTTMPDRLASVDAAQRAEVIDALAAFIGSLQTPFWEVKGSGAVPVPHEFWNKGDVATGRELYHQVGCVACHEPDATFDAVVTSDSPVDRLIDELDADELEAMGLGAAARRVASIPHSNLAEKFTPEGLAMFLLDPHAFRPSGRMPSFKLQPIEAADLSAYLLAKDAASEHASDPPETPQLDHRLIQSGREWFVKLNCIQCHDAGLKATTTSFQPLAELNVSAARGCLATSERSLETSLDFSLDETQTAAITAALLALKPNTGNQSPQQPNAQLQHTLLQHTLLQMNCFACHERDGLGGVGRHRKAYFETVGNVDLGDEGRLPPPLTGVGRKLQPTWFRKVLRGDKTEVRPHMRIRMPVFASRIIETLPPQMAVADHASNASESDVFRPLAGLAATGRAMMDVGCVQCHEFRGFALPGVVGVDLKGVTTRVRPEWFHTFLLNPASVKARTRMPTFFPDGKSQLPTDPYGDVENQVAAMWSYLKELDQQPLPEKVLEANSKNYELKPLQRPILLRTFMPQAGTHSIAVGLPNHINFAFDAEKLRLATIWRGRFLDAQGTWFVRSAPPAIPLGDDVIELPAVVSFALGKEPPQSWPTADTSDRFRGYRLDESGTPTFLYSIGDIDFEDRLSSRDACCLERVIKLSSTSNAEQHGWLCIDDAGAEKKLKITVDGAEAPEWTEVVVTGDMKVVAAKIAFRSEVHLSIRYQW